MEDKKQEKLDKFFLEYGYTLDDFIDDLITYRNLHGGDGEVWIGHTIKSSAYPYTELPVSNICRRISKLGKNDILLGSE